VHRNPQEDEGVSEGDQGTLAISEDAELVHTMIEFRLSLVNWGVTRRTATCDIHHRSGQKEPSGMRRFMVVPSRAI
jgi:hypothetical protein